MPTIVRMTGKAMMIMPMQMNARESSVLGSCCLVTNHLRKSQTPVLKLATTALLPGRTVEVPGMDRPLYASCRLQEASLRSRVRT